MLFTARFALLIAPLLMMGACAQGPQLGGTGLDSKPGAAGSGKSGPVDLATIREPSRLLGLTSGQVQQVLGRPGFQRVDASAEIWQYRGQACILDVYIYEQGSSHVVDYWAVRSPVRVNDADCFQQLVAQKNPQPGS